jgi:hypothetical protein
LAESNTSGVQPEQVDTDQDRYPTLNKVFHRILQEIEIPGNHVSRVLVECLPSGEATYKVTPARADEYIGGYLPPE